MAENAWCIYAYKSLIVREQANALRSPKQDDAILQYYITIIGPRRGTLSLLLLQSCRS